MDEYLDRKPKALSGGQRQRAALGRAIVRKPKVFLFDEPLSNLDAKMRLQMRTEISKLHHRLEATMIYVTHDQTEAMSLADRIVLMKDGWIQQIGTPLKLYNRPVNLFSAGFIGSPPMNFLEGTVEKKGRRIFINIGSGVSFPISESCSARVAASALKKVVAGFRPEDVKLQKGRKAPEEIQMKGTVEVVEQMGSETYLHFMLKQGKKHLVARIDADNKMKAGSEVLLSLDISKVHFFDPETEQVT
jgi:multiple sugar transport system ATP-binding protein